MSSSVPAGFAFTHKAVAILALLISMTSIQAGASLAKSLFPLVGAPGITALRIGLGTIMLCLIFKPWRRRFRPEQRLPLLIYGLALGGMNFLFYLALRTVPLGIAVALEFCGPLTIALAASRRFTDLIWIVLAVTGLYFLLPLQNDIHNIDLTGASLALAAGVCWAAYILFGPKAGADHGAATVAGGSVIASLVFVPAGVLLSENSLWSWHFLPVGLAIAFLSTALPYSLEMIALTRLPARTFGMLMSLEPAMAALSGMLFLGENLTQTQIMALFAIIIASAGSTLMPAKKVKLISLKDKNN